MCSKMKAVYGGFCLVVMLKRASAYHEQNPVAKSVGDLGVFTMASATTYAADELVAAGGVAGLATPRLDLVTAFANPPSKVSVWSDFTIPTYTGYAGPITVTLSAVYISNATQLVSTDVSDAVFNGPTSGAGATVVGWVLHDTTATPVVYACGTFDGPLSLLLPTDRVTVDETIGLGTAVSFNVSN